MLFTAPLWLLGLLPWSAAAALLFLGRRPRWDVPFLQLWQLEMPKDAARRRFAVPPLGVVLGLIAALLAVLAAAGPGLRGAAGAAGTVVIVDTGASMSAAGGSNKVERFRESLDAVAADLQVAGAADMPVQLIGVPAPAGGTAADGAIRTTAGNLSAAARALRPTALATSDSVALAARQALAASDGDVVVITDHALPFSDDRLVMSAPERSPRNVGIAAFALRRLPKPQAMVWISRTGGAAGKTAVKLRISSGGRSTEQDVELPPAGATRDVFIPLATAGATATAELLDAADDFPGDDRADLVAETDWPILEPAAPIGDLRRLADLYAANRPAGERSIHLRLAATEPDLRRSAGVVLASLASPPKPARVLIVAAHPITQAVADWKSFDIPAAEDRKLPEGRWDVLLSDARGPLLAVRELGTDAGAERFTRQAWTALDVAGWSNRPEYVVFWSALFDWAGYAESGERMDAAALTELSGQWRLIELSPGPADARFWPGVYERPSDGARRAFGPAAAFGAVVTLTPAERASRLAAMVRRGEHVTPLSPWLVLAALAVTLSAGVLWKGRRRLASSPQKWRDSGSPRR